MWVGTCWDNPNEEKRPRHQIYTDINAPNREELTDTFINEMEGWGAKVTDATRQRIIAPSWDPICLVGYAVTRKGAQKLLYETSIKGIHVPVDLHMVGLVQDGILNAYTVIPPLISPMIVNDKSDSDINGNAKDESITEHVWERRSENLKKSARAALNKMGSGP
jgi:GR25 family glycosyltransferase involved in LPS biosynthesis